MMQLKKIFNFCAGPAVIDNEVLLEVQQALIDYNNSGMSILSISHRSDLFMEIVHDAHNLIRELLDIPDNYKIAFISGGASEQFSDIPKNLSNMDDTADYALTGHWSRVAFKYANKFINAKGVEVDQRAVCEQDFSVNPAASYLYLTNNETVDGIEFHDISKIYANAKSVGVPIVADMSSNILSRAIDISQYGVIFACAQKNIGPSGLSIVIIRSDLLDKARFNTEKTRHYKSIIAKESVLNTPNTFAIYMASRVFAWVKKNGGVEAFSKKNIVKSNLLYDCIDKSDLFVNNIAKPCRSRMNVPFFIDNTKLGLSDSEKYELEALFLSQADSHNLFNLKGYKALGGMRASLYNAMSLDGAEALVNFMKDFERKYG